MVRDDPGQPARILIVEDNLINIKILEKNLVDRYVLASAAGGREALERVGSFRPDLILLDVMMPDMDGYEVCRRLRRDPATRDIPVLVLTALRQVEALEQAFAAGATDYLTKPFNIRELCVRVENALLLKQTVDRLRRNREQLERDLELAGKLQQTILSTFPVVAGRFDMYPAYRPSTEVAGDVFDVIALPDDRVAVYIGDVAGHGVAAALVSTMVKTTVGELLRGAPDMPPHQLCERLEDRFHDVIPNPGVQMYMTFFAMVYDPRHDSWRCFNCGHPDPLVWRRGEIADLGAAAGRGVMPIGVNSTFGTEFLAADEFVLPNEPDTTILLYTDGLSEARHRDHGGLCDPAGLRRHFEALRAADGLYKIAGRLLDAVEADGYVLGGDDSTALAIHCVAPAHRKLHRHLRATMQAPQDMADAAARAAAASGWPEEGAFGLQLLVAEYVANVVRHGHGAAGDTEIELTLRVYDNYAVLAFRDSGPAWDYDRCVERSRMTTLAATHGRGLAIIENIAEDSDWTRREGANLAIMQIRRDWQVPKRDPDGS